MTQSIIWWKESKFFHMKEMMTDHADLTGRWLGNCEETVLIFKNLLPQKNHVFMLSSDWTLLLNNKKKCRRPIRIWFFTEYFLKLFSYPIKRTKLHFNFFLSSSFHLICMYLYWSVFFYWRKGGGGQIDWGNLSGKKWCSLIIMLIF